jgi:hypothetical protein
MKPSFFRVTLMACAGGYITIMGLTGYAATPLLVIAGVLLMLYSMTIMFSGYDLSGRGLTKPAPAHPCQEMNHAGCQDNPECICACHRERIEISVGSQ